jgi:hypothetical protein
MRRKHHRTASVILAAACLATLLTLASPALAAKSGSIPRWSVMAGPLEDSVQDSVAGPDGSVYSVGVTYSTGQSGNVLVMRNSSSGTLSWWREWDGAASLLDRAVAVAADKSGNVIVAGDSLGTTPGDTNIVVLKYSKSGTLLWQRVYGGAENGDDECSDVVVDSSGAVYVTGSRHTAATSYDFWTLKLAAADGGLIWQHTYDGLGRGDVPGSTCIDSARNVYVAGESGALPWSSDIAIVKIAPDGTTAWAQRVSGPAALGDDWGGEIALGRSGALFVAATAPGEDDQAMMVMRLGTTDGSLKWRRTYDDSLGWHDIVEGMAVDGSNNVWVTGCMRGKTGTSSRGVLSKWNSSGKRLWTQQWSSPGNKPAEFRAVKINSAGTAWCAGYMTTKPGDQEALVVKFASSGRGLWSRAWEGPGRKDDVFDCLILRGSSTLFAGGYSVGKTSGMDAAVVRYVR